MLEHVDEKYMANYMEAFKQARYAIVTHGELGQGGFNHVNNQHAQYWIEKFKEYGFKYEEALSAHARQLCDTSWGLTYQCSEWHPNHPKYNPKCANRRSGRPYSHFSTKGMIFKNTALEFRLDSVDSTISKAPHADFDEKNESITSKSSSATALSVSQDRTFEDPSIQVAINGTKLCFYDNEPNSRGTAVALYDYADFAEQLFASKSLIIFPRRERSDYSSLLKFQRRFDVFLYDAGSNVTHNNGLGGPELPKLAIKLGCKVLYIIKGGLKKDSPVYPESFQGISTAVHAVFHWEPHGTTYASISPDFGTKFVPHMIRPPEVDKLSSLRETLNIPRSAITICRHGGYDTFNIGMAHKAVEELLNKYNESNLHFIFLGTNFVLENHERQLHHIGTTSDLSKKEQFFSACDAMLHARKDGEIFSCAVGEMSMRGKPVITTKVSVDTHIKILGDLAFLYKTKEDIVRIISSFVDNGIPKRDFNAYRPYLPGPVMQKFKEVFIDPIFDAAN